MLQCAKIESTFYFQPINHVFPNKKRVCGSISPSNVIFLPQTFSKLRVSIPLNVLCWELSKFFTFYRVSKPKLQLKSIFSVLNPSEKI